MKNTNLNYAMSLHSCLEPDRLIPIRTSDQFAEACMIHGQKLMEIEPLLLKELI